jgi:hypothetical protein
MDSQMRDSLIRHLKNHHANADTSNFEVLDFVSAFGSPLEALAYSYLFWPDFIEFEGMIFHESVIENEDDRSRIRAALPRLRTGEEVEKSFNQFLIPDDLFSAGLSTTSEAENIFLAERLADAWRARLTVLFPNKKCVVEVELEEENNEGPTIIVYQG